jgi:hypothetical protein
MMEALRSSEMYANLYRTTRRHIPENSILHVYRYRNLKSNTFAMILQRSLAFLLIYWRYKSPVNKAAEE